MNGLELLSEYRAMFLVAAVCIMLIIFIVMVVVLVKKIINIIKESRQELTKDDIKELDFETIAKEDRADVLRRIVAPDAINPGPDDHMIVYDAVNKTYARSLTISRMGKRVNFANTFVPLFNFPNSTYSVFVEPIREQDMSRRLDKRLVVLEAEFISAEGDSNRRRKLQTQYAEANEWAAEVETGKNKFFRVGFLFTLYADSVEELTKKSDMFRNLALSKGMDVTTCVGVQSEAYVANAPLNKYSSGNSPVNANDGVFYHYMDKYAVSTIYNYTDCSFSHKDGIPLGHDRNTGRPVIYDAYHPSFNGYTFCVVGKTGTGKSAMIKMMTYRYSLMDYRFASLDVQPREGTGDGEYAGICEVLGGLNFELKSDSSNCLNIFEVRTSKVFVKTGIGRGYEKETLDLNGAIAQSVNLIKIMISENGNSDSLRDNVIMTSIIREAVKKVFAHFGIVDGDPDSLYTIKSTLSNGQKVQVKVEKSLPTISDFFRVLLEDQAVERDNDKKSMRKIVILAMEDYVKDLYYTEKSLHFFTREEYDRLPVREGTSVHVFQNDDGKMEDIRHVHGTRGYYDGQSTLRYSPDIPWINIDCSQLDESAKKVAMSVGQNYINERIIKGNSENRTGSSKIMIIFDEAHMVFKIKPARELLNEIVRTARKRNVSLAVCTQTLREFDDYEETKGIRKNAAALFVFKQDFSDKDYLIKTLGLTESQVDDILAQGGNLDQAGGSEAEEEMKKEQAKHRGECTIIINRMAVPLKVDYRKRTEKHVVETSAEEIIEDLHSYNVGA